MKNEYSMFKIEFAIDCPKIYQPKVSNQIMNYFISRYLLVDYYYSQISACHIRIHICIRLRVDVIFNNRIGMGDRIRRNASHCYTHDVRVIESNAIALLSALTFNRL